MQCLEFKFYFYVIYIDINYAPFFQSLNLVKIITANKSVNYLYSTYSFGMVCNSNISSYVIQSIYDRILKFDQDWNLIKYSKLPSSNFMITLVDNNVKRLFITRDSYITEIDENLNQIKSVSITGYNYGLYFNSTSIQLLVASGSNATINVFDLNLILMGNISVPYTNNYILEYNGLLYVSSN